MIEIPVLAPGDTLLFTLRHGLTELNRDKRVSGQTLDVPLLPEGVRQAEDARDRFAGTPVDVVISSPLVRAIRTAEIVTGFSREAIEIDPLCNERSFGRMEGLTRAEVEARFPEVRYLQIEHIGYSLNPPGGELFDALQDRARRFLQRVLQRHRNKRLLISSHQTFLQQLHGVLRGLDPFQSLHYDILNLELNLFHLGPQGDLIDRRSEQLVTWAAQYPSF
ncbi:MAG: histidine phosphatase family protein [Armatimonadetes bacterium]|nr:histidine phosphatase family protein [Armatimonadota bacterium]MBI2247906.1 histidine phosphatase family protein [Armatimonadota bacterium]